MVKQILSAYFPQHGVSAFHLPACASVLDMYVTVETSHKRFIFPLPGDVNQNNMLVTIGYRKSAGKRSEVLSP